jgi:hypothetical protein
MSWEQKLSRKTGFILMSLGYKAFLEACNTQRCQVSAPLNGDQLILNQKCGHAKILGGHPKITISAFFIKRH